MRKVKIINIEGRGEVTVKEVTPLSVYQSWGEADRIKSIVGLIDDAISPSVAEIKGWYASEIEEVVAAFMEVNNSFFGIARQLKMDGLARNLLAEMSKNLPGVFASSFNQAMSTLGPTDGLSS